MKIAITGSGGFIGSNLLKSFQDKHNVLPLIIREDTTIENIESEILKFNPDIFIHCGWWGGDSYDNTQDYKQFDNVVMGKELFKIFNKLSNLYFVGIGSFSEYGNHDVLIDENCKELPVSLYGAAKNTFKHFSEYACELNSFRWLWIRPCYVYGPGDLSTRFIPKVIRSCLLNENQVVFDSCESVLDYVYIDDFVGAVNLLMENEHDGVFNICSGKQYKVKDILGKIKSICNSNIEFIFDAKKDRNGFSKYVCGSNNKLKVTTKWEPTFDLDFGLRKTIEMCNYDG